MAASRKTARIVPVDRDGRVMLLRGEPQGGREHWFTVGGEIEPGESPVEAAVRELFEETGIAVDPAGLGGPFYIGPHVFTYNERRFVTLAHFYAVTVDSTARTSFAGLEPGEIVEEVAWRHPGEFDLKDASTPELGELIAQAVAHLHA